MGWFEWIVVIQLLGGLIFLYFIDVSLIKIKPSRKKWVYNTRYFSKSDDEMVIEKDLDLLGKVGWELV